MQLMTMQAAKSVFSNLFLLLSLLWIATTVPALAQGGQNPFEIRASKNTPSKSEEKPAVIAEPVETASIPEEYIATEVEIIENTSVPSTDNPLEIQPSENSGPSINPTNTTTEIIPNSSDNPFELSPSTNKESNTTARTTTLTPPPERNSKKETDQLPPSKNNSSFLFILIVAMVLIFTIVVTLFRDFVKKSYQAFANDGQVRNIYREQSSILMSPYLVLYILFVINAGIFIYLTLDYYNIGITKNWWGVLSIIGGLGLVFVCKHLLLTVISTVFPISKEIELYNFTIVIFNIILGLIFIPINLLLAYGPDNVINPLLYLTFSIIGLLYVYRSVRGLLISGKHFSSHKFHFFMYLCTAEFAPLLLLVKYLSKQF